MHKLAIVGAGVVGLATANALLNQGRADDLVVLEKESVVAAHQTGHNSGVIHSGAYYRPGSKKAEMCLRGRRLLLEFCDTESIPYKICGKLIVACTAAERSTLAMIRDRAIANGVPGVRELDASGVRQMEPMVRGVAGLEVPTAGIVDYREVSRVLAERIRKRGATIMTKTRLTGIRECKDGLMLETDAGELRVGSLVNCAGLQSDRVARLAGLRPMAQIVPFRGEYYWLKPGVCADLRRLVYPVPDPDLPFLGVHLTLTLRGRVEVGPNAVFALAREGYHRSDVEGTDLAETFSFPGFWRMARQHWRTGIFENYRSLDRERFAADVSRLVPSVRADDLGEPGAGVRAQAVGSDGRLIDDFVIQTAARSIHVLNAPSPAATSSFAIGEEIARLAPSLGA